MNTISDNQLVQKIMQNPDNLGIVYRNCKTYSMKFMRSIASNKLNEYELEDVFHDSVIILYEKIIKGNFELKASLQTYLNSVCRYQLLNKFKKDNTHFEFEENNNNENDDENTTFNPFIVDDLEPIEDEKEIQFVAMERALEKMKIAGGHCYELLTLFWYHKKSHEEIAKIMNYSNDKTSKKQKSGCQEKLRTMAFNAMNN